jgi:aryl-alcohol dehydrogenase-like predicted oxidoreductase
LAKTGVGISAIAFGAGPVSGLMTSDSAREQLATVERAITRGINWFDTAATYGAGQSESSLGDALADLQTGNDIHVATKVRLAAEDLVDIKEAVKRSVAASLRRLRRKRVTLLQVHNSITRQRGDLPTSIMVEDVIGRGGMLEAFEELRAQGLVGHFGLTGMGDGESLRQVMQQGPWSSIQVNEHALIRRPLGPESLLAACAENGVGVLAIRVFAGGALSGQPPSAHTLKTPFYPLPIYERDQANAQAIDRLLPETLTLPEVAIRHVLNSGYVTTAIIGFATPNQVDDAIRWAERGAVPTEIRECLTSLSLPEELP